MLDIIEVTSDNSFDLGYVHALAWSASHKNMVSKQCLARFTPEKRAAAFRLEMSDSNQHYYVAYLKCKPIGMLILNPTPDNEPDTNIGEVKSIYFLPEYLGKGYGKRLMDFAVSQLKSWNKTTIILWVLKENERAINFYQKYGYVFEKMICTNGTIPELKYKLCAD